MGNLRFSRKSLRLPTPSFARIPVSLIFYRDQVLAHHDAIPAPAFAAEHGPVSDEQQLLPVLGVFRQGGDAVAGRNLDRQPLILQEGGLVEGPAQTAGSLQGVRLGPAGASG